MISSYSKSPYSNLPPSVAERLYERKSRFNGMDLSESDIEAIVRSAATHQDLELDMSGAALGEDGALLLADSISRNNFSSFVRVNLNVTKLNRQGLEAFIYVAVEFKNLESLSLRGNDLPKEAGISIAKILGAKGKLRLLDLQDNNIGDVGVAAIAGAFTADLRDITYGSTLSLLTLEVLDLSGNHFGDSAILALCRGLLHFSKHTTSIKRIASLRVLKFNRNNLGDKAAMCLAQLLQSSSSSGSLRLAELHANDNPIGFRGMISLLSICQAGGNSSLEVLSLARCRPALSVLDMTALVLGSPSQLKYLDISLNESASTGIILENGFAETMIRLAQAARANGHLKSLCLGDLPEVLQKSLQGNHIGSVPYRKVQDCLDALRSVRDILALSSPQQEVLSVDSLPSSTPPPPPPTQNPPPQEQSTNSYSNVNRNDSALHSFGNPGLSLDSTVTAGTGHGRGLEREHVGGRELGLDPVTRRDPLSQQQAEFHKANLENQVDSFNSSHLHPTPPLIGRACN